MIVIDDNANNQQPVPTYLEKLKSYNTDYITHGNLLKAIEECVLPLKPSDYENDEFVKAAAASLHSATENAENLFEKAQEAAEGSDLKTLLEATSLNAKQNQTAAEVQKTASIAVYKAKRDAEMAAAREQLNSAANSLEDSLKFIQTYNHIEMLIAFRMAAPLSIPGLLMFIISASYGDINFSNQDVQTTLVIGFVASLGTLGAAWYIKSILHKKWHEDVDQAKADYETKLNKYMEEYLGTDAAAIVSAKIAPLIAENVKYAQENWYPHIDTDELNLVGFRKSRLDDDTTDSPQLAHHKDRRQVSTAGTVALNFVGLVCAVILAGMAHEKRAYLHSLQNKIPQMPGETPPPASSSSGDWFIGQDPAFYAVAGLLILCVAMSVFMGVREYNKATQKPLLTGSSKSEANSVSQKANAALNK